jgi:hypothetical protein
MARTCVICFFFCLLLLIVERHYGYAFYRESNDSNLSSFQFERIRGFYPGRPGVLAVSDNYSCMLEKHSQRPLVYRNSDRFVAMDLLEINLPINVALYRPGSLDNSLSDIFYADLKLKKLQDEYGKLQGRARELLAELGLSTRDLSFDAGGTRHPDQVLEQPSLSATAFKPAGTQRPDQALRPTSISAARNELMRDHASITKAPRLTPLVRVSSSKGLLRSALPLGAIKESLKWTEPDSDTKAEARRMTNQNGSKVFNEDSLTGKLFKMVCYILSHKLEALFLLVVLIVLLKLVSLGRR